jgi:hypothetical protein
MEILETVPKLKNGRGYILIVIDRYAFNNHLLVFLTELGKPNHL